MLAKVRHDQYLKFVWPLLAILFILICAFVGLGATMS
ncbi:putative ion transporter superfamily protein YfcC [Streptacidiphilus sp. MAP12-20]